MQTQVLLKFIDCFDRKSRCLGRQLKGVLHRSHSLTCLHSLAMSSSYVCPCCFLNRISSLRNTPESSWELMNQETHNYRRGCQKEITATDLSPNNKATRSSSSNSNKACSELSNLDHSSVSLVKFDIDMFDGENHNFMYPERLVNNSGMFQSSETFTFEESNTSLLTLGSKIRQPASVVQSRDRTEFLTEQIDYMLQEQRQFFRELELPIVDEGGFKLKKDQLIEVQVTNEGDSIKVNRKIISKASQRKKERNKKTRTGKSTNKDVYFASGDQDNISNFKIEKNTSDDALSLFNFDEVKQLKKHKKLKDSFKEEPVKLSKKIEWAVPVQTSFGFNKDHNTEKNISVKMIFCPDGELKCSTSSIESCGEAKSLATTSSAYVTAANSSNDGFREFNTNEGIYTIAGSSSNMSVNITSSESRGLLEKQ